MPLTGATILQVIPELSAGGAERTVIEVVQALTDVGAKGLVASQGGRLEDALAEAGGELIRLDDLSSKNPAVIFANARKLSHQIRSRKIDLIHARSRAPAWSALWAARRTGSPFVTTYHGIYSGKTPLKRLYNSVMARGDIVIANSGYTADHVVKQHKKMRDRIVIIPRGVDIDAFTPAAVTFDRIGKIRRRWSIPEEQTDNIILLPARLTSWKGHRETVTAASLLLERGVENWKMIFVGDAQGRERYLLTLDEQIRLHGLQEKIFIAGHCSDMPAAFAIADFAMAPSILPEAFGRVAAEAGAMEIPTIASDLGGQKEIIEHGITGLLVPPANVEGLADAIEKLIRLSAEDRAKMGKAARTRVEERFTSTVLQKSTLAQYERLLNRTNA